MSDTARFGSVSYLRIAWLIVNTASTVAFRSITYPFRKVRAPTFFKDVHNAAVRCMMNRVTVADSRYLMARTSESYVQQYCKPRGLEPKTLRLDTSNGRAVAHWIGDPDADAIILYCHGGGYVQPANLGNYRHLHGLVEALNSDEGRPSVSVLLLAYTLVPEAIYPTQLREAAVVLAHLVHDTGRSPSKIFVAGDSAGGNLVFSLLSHMLHPHPDVFALKFDCPLGGGLLLSPWVSFRTDYPSFSSNATLDLVSPLPLRKWTAMFLGKANASDPESDPGLVTGDCWNEACSNPPSWWNGMHQVVSGVFIWWGGHEVFVDPIRELERNFAAGWTDGGGERSRAIFLESAEEAHVALLVDAMMSGAKKSEAQVEIEEWFKGRLHSEIGG